MTSKEYTAIREFYGKHSNLRMYGHVWLHPKAIKHIRNPSDSLKLWARKKKSLYLHPKMMRVDGNNLRMYDQFSGLISIDRRWIKTVLLYHYNH